MRGVLDAVPIWRSIVCDHGMVRLPWLPIALLAIYLPSGCITSTCIDIDGECVLPACLTPNGTDELASEIHFAWDLDGAGPLSRIELLFDKGTNPCDGSIEFSVVMPPSSTSTTIKLDQQFFTDTEVEWAVRVSDADGEKSICSFSCYFHVR